MSDLIDRQQAIEALEKCHKKCCREDTVGDEWIHYETTLNEIETLSSAQPEIVRCKDCAKREICRTSTVWAVAPGDDWYCADAERRTDEE